MSLLLFRFNQTQIQTQIHNQTQNQINSSSHSHLVIQIVKVCNLPKIQIMVIKFSIFNTTINNKILSSSLIKFKS